jgi:DNA-binding LacI/PurR family transcriptional regulator
VVLRSVTRRTILTRIERFSHAFQAAAGEAASITVLDTPLRASVTELKQTLATALAETDATAIFGCVDLLAVGALGALADLGLRAPTDISVVGFDDLPVSALTTPPLTTVCIDRARLGAYAVRQAAARADDPAAPPLRLVLGCPLVERGSLGPVPVTPPSRKIAQ